MAVEEKSKKHEYSKPRKEQMHEHDPLLDEVSQDVEEELLSGKEHELSEKPTELPKKVRGGRRESYRPLHRK